MTDERKLPVVGPDIPVEGVLPGADGPPDSAFPVEIEVVDSRGTKSVQAFRIEVGIAATAPPARPAD